MKLLLVDDHQLFRQGLELLLLNIEEVTQVLHASSGNPALQQIHDHPDIDLILLDYNLGDGIGLDVLTRIKAHDPSLPVAMISGETNPRVIQRCMDSGVNAYILKNMDASELSSAVKKVLGGEHYIPHHLLHSETPSNEVVDSSMDQLADVARDIIRNKDLSLRADQPGDAPCEVISAFNSLLDDINHKHSELNDLAFNDELTGLANRRLFMERLDQAIKVARRTKKDFALIYMDLDYFKQVNDTLGHDIGDILLVEISTRLKVLVREIDTVARLGGDEFTIILSDIENRDNAEALVIRMLEGLRQPIQLGEKAINPSMSLGITLCKGASLPSDIIKRADKALYIVKEKGRNNYHFN